MKTSRHILPLPLSLLLIVLSAEQGLAQQAEVETRVSHIAGTTIYLDLGRDDGPAPGDTLFIFRESLYQGFLIVENVSSRSLSARYGTENIFPLTRGEVVTVRFRMLPEEREEAAQRVSEHAPPSIMGAAADEMTAPPLRPEISGRLIAGGSLLHSQTKWGELIDRTTDRIFISPFTDLNLSASRLPGGLRTELALSYTYRYSGNTPVSSDQAVRFYRLNVEKSFSALPLTVTAGRFYNRQDIFSGFWDGVMLRLGDRGQGVGVVGGFEPLRGDEGFSSDLPKYSFFAYKDLMISNIRSRTELSFNTVLPSIQLENHLFAGLYQHFRIGRNRLTVNLQADQNPADDSWMLSQTLVRGLLALNERLELHGAYNRRQPYRIYIPADPVGYERTQLTGGAGYRFQKGYLGADLSVEEDELNQSASAISAYGSVRKSRFWELGFSATAQYREGDEGNSLRVRAGIDRYFREVHLVTAYQFYHADYAGTNSLLHGGELSVMAPILKEWYLNAQVRSEFGELLIHNSLYFSIWRAF